MQQPSQNVDAWICSPEDTNLKTSQTWMGTGRALRQEAAADYLLSFRSRALCKFSQRIQPSSGMTAKPSPENQDDKNWGSSIFLLISFTFLGASDNQTIGYYSSDPAGPSTTVQTVHALIPAALQGADPF